MIVRLVESPRDLDRFIRYPFDRYRGDPYWVAPLPGDERIRLTPGKNPYFEHAEAALFLALEGDRVVGRVSASTDRNYDSFHGEHQATFGFFEARDADVAAALLAAARDWSRSRGADVLRGPFSFTSNDECGLLIDGFDRRPILMMPYNVPEYAGWIEAAGLTKAKDLYSFKLSPPWTLPPAASRIAAAARRREPLATRPIDLRRFERDLGLVKEIYNAAWEKNWGFVPMTEGEIDHMAKQLKPVIIPDFVRLAFAGDRPVGFALVMPDVNEVLAAIHGRLFPFGIVRLLWSLPRIRTARVMALGIVPEYRRRGLAPILIEEVCAVGTKRAFVAGELGWTLEDNDAVNNLIEDMGGVRSTVHRIYEARLGG